MKGAAALRKNADNVPQVSGSAAQMSVPGGYNPTGTDGCKLQRPNTGEHVFKKP